MTDLVNTPIPPAPSAPTPAPSIRVHVLEEGLEVHKRLVETGSGVRISKRVHEDAAHVEETLMREDVTIERIPRDVIVDTLPQPREEAGILVIPVVAEVLVVHKRYRIVEELRVTRVRSEERHATTIPVRTEEVIVASIDDHRPD